MTGGSHSRWPTRCSPTSSSRHRSWAEKVYPNLVYFNEVDRGGHFAAWEEPQLFADELRAAFRSLRQ
jgi:pimeloyl-ACP methyl ester carboxylesterase